MRPPSFNGPEPNSRPPSCTTSWPAGNSEARISASVIARLPDPVGQCGEILRRHAGNGRGIGDALLLPDVHAIGAGAEAFQPLRQAALLGLQHVEPEGRRALDQTNTSRQ